MLSKRIKNISNQRFGSLIAIEPHHIEKTNNTVYWKYVCICGKEHIARGNTVTFISKKGDTELPSCGCIELKRKTKHGYRKINNTHALYRTYRSIMTRCYDKNSPEYKWYGEQNITICEEWKNNPQKFIEWGINNGWKKDLVLDKDILCKKLNIFPKIYSPQTCQFISKQLNPSFSNNRDNYGKHKNIKISNDDVIQIKQFRFIENKSYSEISRMYKVSPNTISRIFNI